MVKKRNLSAPAPPPLSDTTPGKGHIRPGTLVRRKVLSRNRMGTDLDVSIRYRRNGAKTPLDVVF
jgi:hypothetical protein